MWNNVKDEMVHEKNICRKNHNFFLFYSQRYPDSRHILQNPKVPLDVMGFSNLAQRLTGPIYLDVDKPQTQEIKF